jgi:pimeloyl-ACP methyl ester carboxylesterase
MTQKFFFNKRLVNFRDIGKGKPVVLLHGYLESLKIWDEFSSKLSENCRIIAIDLPGHGESDPQFGRGTIKYMAEVVNAVLEKLRINKALIVGHSMGGYVALSFKESFSEKAAGMVLFHSLATADSEEKKAARQKEIELVKNGKKDTFINANIKKAFANENAARFYDEIIFAKKIGMNTSEKGIISALESMMDRPDRTHVLKNGAAGNLLIAGAKDNYIPIEKMIEQAESSKNITFIKLEKSGHLGFIEEYEKSVNVIFSFMNKCL